MSLRERVEALAAQKRERYGEPERTLFAEFRAALTRGEIRAAGRAPDGAWCVNAWVKQGILLGFRMGVLADMSAHPTLRFFDKDTYPVRPTTLAARLRPRARSGVPSRRGAAARDSPRRGRGAGRAGRAGRVGRAVGHLAVRAGHREVSGREDRRRDSARGVPAMKEQRVAVLGLGKIGNILLQGLLKAGLPPKNAVATVRHPERAQSLGKERAVPVGSDNRAAVRGADVVIIAVKPQNVRELLEEIRADVTPAQLVISVAASVPTGFIENILATPTPVVRAMPNTPSQVGAGMTGICRGKHATDAHLDTARRLFDTVGRTVVVDEKHMDAVTGLSASGPARSE